MTMLKQYLKAFLLWLADTSGISLGARLSHTYLVECFGPDGVLKWSDSFRNLVTTAGLNKYLSATLKDGLAAPAWYVSLVKAKTTGYAAGDTMASHGGWTEGVPGTDWTGNRIAFTPGAISGGSVDNSGAKATFPILESLTIAGALLCDAATGSGAGVTLLGVGDFTGGSKGVALGDTLTITVTASLTAS